MSTTSTVNTTGSNAAILNNINQQNAASQKQVSTNTLNSNTAAGSQAQFSGNLNTFLNMLTVQLKNQDPLSPMDSTQFTNQLVQFSAVEQQINTNSNLESLISLQKVSQQATAVNYIGRTVSYSGNTLPLYGGQAAFDYTMPKDAATIAVQIKDSNGNVVNTLTSPDGSAGTHSVTWDGTDSNGAQLKDGKYSINIIATDANGDTITPTVNPYGVVTGVTSDSSGVNLEFGNTGVTVALDSINSIHVPMNSSNSQTPPYATPTLTGANNTFSDGVSPTFSTAANSAVIKVNGPVGSSSVDLSGMTLAQAASAINGVTSSTGVTATVSGNSLVFGTTKAGAASISGGTGDATALNCTIAA